MRVCTRPLPRVSELPMTTARPLSAKAAARISAALAVWPSTSTSEFGRPPVISAAFGGRRILVGIRVAAGGLRRFSPALHAACRRPARPGASTPPRLPRRSRISRPLGAGWTFRSAAKVEENWPLVPLLKLAILRSARPLVRDAVGCLEDGMRAVLSARLRLTSLTWPPALCGSREA